MADLESAKAAAIASVHDEHTKVINDLTGHATDAEQKTWPIKDAAATAYTLGNQSDAELQMLEVEATILGKSIDDHVSSILRNADAFKAVVGYASGMRTSAIEAISSAESLEELAAIIATLKEQETQAIQSLQSGAENA